MKTAKELDYIIHHLCVYDKDPRKHMWPYLRWHHGITNFFSGATYHITDEGHSDYTFLGCGGRAFQIQLEAPPFQFKYEQEWYAKYGNAYNHICWIVNNARESYDQIREAGAAVCQEFQPFPTYDGFVVRDPEDRWIEIMEYTHPVFRVQEFTNQPSGPCGLQMLGFIEVVNDLEKMVDWYCHAMGHQVLKQVQDGNQGLAVLSDQFHDPVERNALMILTTPHHAADRQGYETHGPHISGILYQALDLQAAYDDAIWAGMESIEAPTPDPLTGTLTARLREPSGNQIVLVAPPDEEGVMILAFAHPGLVVPDLDRAREFYERMFGFRVIGEEGWQDDPVIDRGIGSTDSTCSGYTMAGHNCFLELFEFTAPEQEGPRPGELGPHEQGIRHLAFYVDDCRAEYRRLLDLGGETLGEPVGSDEAGYVVYCRDPFGNIIELCEIPVPDENPTRLPGVDRLGDFEGSRS